MPKQDQELLRQQLKNQIPHERDFEAATGYSEAAIKQGTWLTTTLWNDYGWSEVLTEYGISWQKFMKAFRWSQYDFLKWQRDRKNWEAAMNEFIEQILEETSAG